MDLREFKPLLTTLMLPPTGPLLLALLGMWIARRRRAFGLGLATTAIVLALVLSTNGMALLLARWLMPPQSAATLDAVGQVQAIVVLGAGVLPEAPEYGAPQPSLRTLSRLRYGAWLARKTGKPLAFGGGVGWAAAGTGAPSEAQVAQQSAQEDFHVALRWIDDQSRDTSENAARMAQQLQPQGIRRIALVTDATHMPRAAGAFRAAGFDVLPAPTNFRGPRGRALLEWLPSDRGARACGQILHEWLGRLVARAD